MDKLQIQYTPLSDFKRWNRNPKEHDIGTLHQSISRFGFNDPVCVNLRTGTIIEGHGRIDTLQQWKVRGDPPPERIEAKNGEWLVPTFFVDMDEREAEAYALAHNRITEVGGWDEADLAEVLSDLVVDDLLEGIGFDTDDLDELLKSIGQADPPPDPGAQMDKAEELQKVWQVERGQVWEIPSLSVEEKAHRVMCGDSTSEEDVGKLMGSEKGQLFATDPPYGVSYGDIAASRRASGYASPDRGRIENDDLEGKTFQEWLTSAFKVWLPYLQENAAWYLWHAQKTQGYFTAAAAAAADVIYHRQIVWVKPSLILGRGDYHWRHELCLYGWRKGNRPPWLMGRDQDTVWEVSGIPIADKHPTEKPIELFTRPIRNHLEIGQIEADPFLGSGTTAVAAEQTGRIGYGMEICEKYVSVTLQRLADMGLEPKLTQ